MTQRDSALFKTGWISLAIIGLAILVFGLITALMPASSGPPYLRAIGVASIGMGLFGLLITTIAYRRRERWAWFALWYYPVFWTAHLAGGLPPGKDHVHQGRVHRTVARGPAPARARVLPAEGGTGTHALLRCPTAANFLELRH
jgi:hypothetical protein